MSASRRLMSSLHGQWICPSCAKRAVPNGRATSRQSTTRRFASTTTASPPHMSQWRAAHSYKNRTAVYYTLSGIVGTVALSYGSVPLYKTICQQTGWGGQPIRVHGDPNADPTKRLTPLTEFDRLRITFAGTTSDVLPWKFTPQQREVRVLPGETALAFYTATNESDADIIGVATYSVSPGSVAPYFSKIQCFCFEEQRLNAGETVDMPVFFYIDPEFVNDPEMRNVNTVVLNYTFFKAKYDDNGVLKPVPTGK